MARALDAGALPERLLSAYLRVMPGGAAWLQAALGAQVQRVVEESERGLCLMADAMDAYLSLPAALKAEVDRDVERGEVAALGEHLHVVEVLSARGAALCTSCEALLEGVLRAAPAAPAGLRRIARALRAAGSAEGGGGGDGGGTVPASAAGDGGNSGGRTPLAVAAAAGDASQELANCSVRELKAMLAAAGVDAAGLLEKDELLQRLHESQQQMQAAQHEVPPSAARGDDGGDDGGGGGGAFGGAMALARELLLGLLLSPATGCPEGFGLLLRCPVGARARLGLGYPNPVPHPNPYPNPTPNPNPNPNLNPNPNPNPNPVPRC